MWKRVWPRKRHKKTQLGKQDGSWDRAVNTQIVKIEDNKFEHKHNEETQFFIPAYIQNSLGKRENIERNQLVTIFCESDTGSWWWCHHIKKCSDKCNQKKSEFAKNIFSPICPRKSKYFLAAVFSYGLYITLHNGALIGKSDYHFVK